MAFKVLFPDTEYSRLEIRSGKWNMIDFSHTYIIPGTGEIGEMEISATDGNECITYYLNQEEIIALIAHLQKQIKKTNT